MFKTIGIRTLLMACGAMTLTTLTTHQLLAEDLKKDLFFSKPQSVSVEEGVQNKVLTFTLQNVGTLKLSVFFHELEFKLSPETDVPADGLFGIRPNPSAFTINLESGEPLPVPFEFNTDFIRPSDKENNDTGVTSFVWPVYAKVADTKEEPQFVGDFFGNVAVRDPGVSPVPEVSSLVLVGACALSVCGFGWLRRRRIPSAA
jgi:hypothetical protein